MKGKDGSELVLLPLPLVSILIVNKKPATSTGKIDYILCLCLCLFNFYDAELNQAAGGVNRDNLTNFCAE